MPNITTNYAITYTNLSISTGIVPDKIKIARVIPVYKSDNPSVFCNYRQISILPCFPKF